MDSIKEYYDLHVVGKLDGFLNGNERVERAWQTLLEHFESPGTVLEIGCGIGDISWRMSNEWKNARITGIDISPKSIEFATKVFTNSRLKFVEGILPSEHVEGNFDLIVMMDVFEHIAKEDRKNLYSTIKQLLSPDGFFFMSFPTPKHLQWLRDFHPEQIQPVDEDVDLRVICDFAEAIGKGLILYKEICVWYQGDYAHAIFGNRDWKEFTDRKTSSDWIRIEERTANEIDKTEKLRLIRQKLGANYV